MLMLTPHTKRNISRILPFGLIWLIFSLVYSFLEKGLLGDLSHYPATGNPYDFLSNITMIAIGATLVGLFLGTVEIMYLNKFFSQKSFGQKLFYKSLFYILIMISFLLSITLINNAIELKKGIFDKQVLANVWVFFTSFAFWSVEIYIAIIIEVSLFYSEVSQNLGQGVVNNFFTGKYHQPIEEERIFMFLDMKSSTTIAEKLGHTRYFEMLRMYYSDLSDAIIQYQGTVNQYVGDEVIITWSLKNGLANNNCLECFFAMKKSLKHHARKYQNRFGLVPTFKAGIHYGMVTTGEIGVIKRDLIFTGDVLNTAARIQGLCNSYNVALLISEVLIEKMNLNGIYTVQSLGKSELRGKDEKVTLYTIIKKTDS